jgi:hypothetical protein
MPDAATLTRFGGKIRTTLFFRFCALQHMIILIVPVEEIYKSGDFQDTGKALVVVNICH